jgi:two-component system chemotaxis response regulator CheY
MSIDVLIVDDNRFMRQVVAHALKMAPIDLGAVREAENGEQALKLIRVRPVGLVMLDLVMPVMDGEQFLGELRADPLLARIPVTVITSDTNAARRERLRALQAQVIGKPFRAEELANAFAVLGVAYARP